MADQRRRFTIKPFRTHLAMDHTEASRTWDVLAKAMDEIYNRNASQLSFEELYRNAYNLVLHKHGDLLYDGVSEKIASHLNETVIHKLLLSSSNVGASSSNVGASSSSSSTATLITTATAPVDDNATSANFLQNVADVWKEHQITMTMIRDILMYMDRIYIQQSRRRRVHELGLHLFRVTVWEHPVVKTRVVDLLLEGIASERAGMLTDDRDLFKTVIGMLLEIGNADATATTYYSTAVYHNDFESVFLATTQEFYHSESLQYLSAATATDYVRKAAARLEEEKERATALQFPATTTGPLMALVQTEWIERHAKTLVEMETTGFAALLRDETKKAEMREMYDLFSAVPSSVEHLREALAERIKADGRQLIKDQEKGQSDPSLFCRGVLAMRSKYHAIVEHSFADENKAQKRMRESFEDFLNADARAASCLAVYVDELLRVGLRGATDEQVKEQLQQAIVIFRYLSDKDIFESFYKQHLAKRLLGGRSVSDDAERTMVSSLKTECGYQFTTKLEGMFNDMRISRETRDKYKSYKRQEDSTAHSRNNASNRGSKSAVDIEVDVLTTGYWPSHNVPPCTLPQTIQEAIDHFSDFYLNEHTGRKLSWQTSAGVAELRATFNGGRRHELVVTTYQMCILVLFNNVDTLTLGQIRMQTQIPDSELRRHLISLCTPKNRILKKGSKGRGIVSDSDTFTFHADYTSKLKRVRIPLVKESSVGGAGLKGTGPQGEGGKATAAVPAGAIPVAVEEDRRHLVEAAIVRIMKARRTLDHNNLIAEVTKQLSVRFTPTPQFIKKRIESLIEREYLERAEDEHRIYHYVA